MRQISAAMLMYIQDNKGKHPPAGAPKIAGVYPFGWWYANELVRRNYIRTPGVNVYKKPNSLMRDKKFNRNNPFRCPEGIDEDWALWGDNAHFPDPDYPTDALNNGYTVLNDPLCAQEGFGIPSWYQLNSRVQNATSNKWPGGTAATPFVWFNSDETTTLAVVKDPIY